MEQNVPGEEKAKPVRTQTIPLAEIDLGNVVTLASAKWKGNPWLTMLWLKQAEFDADAKSFNAILGLKMDESTDVSPISTALGNLDKIMDGHMSYVKGYIDDKYDKKDATSYYGAFGFVYKYKKYAFPLDQNRRLAALKLMVSGLKKHDLEDRKYGLTFWTDIMTNYETLLGQSNALDGDISVKVGEKNVIKKRLKKALTAIVYGIKSNKPDTYKQELRDWGFQKEKY
ncbi:hypothetical protein [Flavobacterium sp. SM2513]|uniref:hypothetical protein n=1 Tax=Flavobacterium sp. SM2513 TaxID=3424766 RepID=UPI003D7F87C6